MSKLQLKLQEATVTDEMVEELLSEEPVEELIEEEETETIFTDETSDAVDFVDSDELNEIREILLNIPDDISLLLLDADCVVLGTEIDNKSMVYTLTDESEDIIPIEMPLELNDILASEAIIKYTEEAVYDKHSTLVDILNKKKDVKEDEPEEKVEEPTEEEDEQNE